MVSSPMAPRHTTVATDPIYPDLSNLKTPSNPGRLYPSREEMHPSKVQQSTAKQPDSGLRLGFVDIGARTDPVRAKAGLGLAQETPTRARPVPAKLPSSPGFEFKFTRRSPDLGPEAQKMMDDLREEALRIKAQLVVEQKEARMYAPAEAHDVEMSGTGRRIARAKGKVGRFSDVHMAEFRKMDSIAGHPSAYRLQPAGNPSSSMSRTTTTMTTTKTTSLKRSKSQAKLDEPDPSPVGTPSPKKPQDMGLQEMSRMKRMKQRFEDDTSSARPVSRNGPPGGKPSTVGLARSQSGLPSAVLTPTKASLARVASVKHVRTMIPSISRSSSTRTPGVGAKSEGSNKHLSSLANLSRVRSILRRPRLFSTEEDTKPDAAEATTPTPTPKNTIHLDKELPLLPGEQNIHLQTPSVKRVNFTPNTKTAPRLFDTVPSPIKSLVQQSPSTSSLPALKYPSVPSSGPEFHAGKAPTGDFTFRSSSSPFKSAPIRFGPALSGSNTSGSTTIRYVRPSVGGETGRSTMARSAASPLQAVVPHGMPNKKRRYEDIEGDSDEENRAPTSSKRQQLVAVEVGKSVVPPAQAPAKNPSSSTSRIPSSASPLKRGRQRAKGILSASRLNALARPKDRRMLPGTGGGKP